MLGSYNQFSKIYSENLQLKALKAETQWYECGVDSGLAWITELRGAGGIVWRQTSGAWNENKSELHAAQAQTICGEFTLYQEWQYDGYDYESEGENWSVRKSWLQANGYIPSEVQS